MTFVITGGFCLLLLILRYGYAPYGFFKKIGIPGPKPLPFIGTFLEYRKVRHICQISTVILQAGHTADNGSEGFDAFVTLSLFYSSGCPQF